MQALYKLPIRQSILALIMILPVIPLSARAGDMPESPASTDTAAVAPSNNTAATPPTTYVAPRTMRFITLGRVKFVHNKWELTDAAKHILDDISAFLLANPRAERLILYGYTDWVGSMKFNDELSDKRTMAVQNYLVSKGVEPALFFQQGYGKRAPIDENWTRLGRDRNRMVELFAVYLPNTEIFDVSNLAHR